MDEPLLVEISQPLHHIQRHLFNPLWAGGKGNARLGGQRRPGIGPGPRDGAGCLSEDRHLSCGLVHVGCPGRGSGATQSSRLRSFGGAGCHVVLCTRSTLARLGMQCWVAHRSGAQAWAGRREGRRAPRGHRRHAPIIPGLVEFTWSRAVLCNWPGNRDGGRPACGATAPLQGSPTIPPCCRAAPPSISQVRACGAPGLGAIGPGAW